MSFIFILSISLYLFYVLFFTNSPKPKIVPVATNIEESILHTKATKIELTNNNKQLTSYVIDNQSLNWVIIVHGYQSSSGSMDFATTEFDKQNYNVLVVDLQGHGQSEGHVTTFGNHDSKDIVAWTNYIESQYPCDSIVLYGVSMGASTILNGSDMYSSSVKVIISDSAFTSIYDIFTFHVQNNLSVINDLLLTSLEWFSTSLLETNIHIGPSHYVATNDIPTLFIHGTNDEVVPLSNVYKLYQSNLGKKQLYIVEGAGHVGSHNINNNKYWDTIFSFIDTS